MFEKINNDNEVIIINCMVLTSIYFIYRKIPLNLISDRFQKKEILLIITLLMEMVSVSFLLLQYKNVNGMLPSRYIMLAVLFTFIIVLCLYLFLYKTKYQEEKKELEVYKTYNSAFEDLVTEIRVRQHEFDNHINAICNLHYVCDNYDELVAEQSKYAADVINDNKFNKLLSSGNPVLSGFLYGRLRTIESKGILTSYKINIRDIQSKVPVYLIIELIGNLLNNAVDALSQADMVEKHLYVECIEDDEKIAISVWNTSRKISYSEMEHFFDKGYSSKGEKRGLGLYHVKTICAANNIDIICENRFLGGKNWIVFELHIKK
jgi:two-component system sensor histidine kinase AgrC